LKNVTKAFVNERWSRVHQGELEFQTGDVQCKCSVRYSKGQVVARAPSVGRRRKTGTRLIVAWAYVALM
jgi:hypothetical protein